MALPLTYIVRIYRRGYGNRVSGVVEVVRTGKRVSFERAEQLWDAVNEKPQRSAKRGPGASSTARVRNYNRSDQQ